MPIPQRNVKNFYFRTPVNPVPVVGDTHNPILSLTDFNDD